MKLKVSRRISLLYSIGQMIPKAKSFIKTNKRCGYISSDYDSRYTAICNTNESSDVTQQIEIHVEKIVSV